MTLKDKVVLLEKKLAFLYWMKGTEVPTMGSIKRMESEGFNSSLEDISKNPRPKSGGANVV